MHSFVQRVLLLLFLNGSLVVSALATCTAPANPIEAENCLPGAPQSQWAAVDGASDLLGFATDMSVNAGQTIFFKISTNAPSVGITIYRLGYYQGLGARLIATLPAPPSSQSQPACLTDNSTGLTDCGNWGVSSSWTVPASAVSGIYLARLFRADTGETSPILFVVRNDSSHSSILMETSDETWQAYNSYGGNSLYVGNPAGRAYKVSYNRPTNYDSFFTSEYPMVRWLEANGYDVTYSSEVDAERNGALIQQHHIFLSVGHDEYWSGGQRANVEAARAAGVDLAFFSGNEIFWKTRWEPSIDGSGTAYRTLVCYKESLAGAVIDPADPPTWTGMWRDPRFSPPADGGRPENALSGTLPWVSSPRKDSITVPQADGRMRFWRNTTVASLSPGQTATMPAGTLGVEWDADVDNGFRPAGLIPLSTTTLTVPTCILGYTTVGTCTATHHLTFYRSSSGALVFGAGTEQWSWGLDSANGFTGVPTDPRMQQATVNLLADMGAQPATLQSGLVLAVASTDTTPPVSVITSPASGTTVVAHNPVTVTGTAADSGGGVVGAVEVSIDGGDTWHPAQGRESWSYTFVPATSGSVNVQSRAADDSGNLETPSSSTTLAVNPPVCPCTIWPSNAAPNVPDAGAYAPLELGVQFRSDTNGYITGIRFYKSPANTGVHAGNLWSSTGSLLATAVFTSESFSGWQQANFATPVAITANTSYVASYHTTVGHFSMDETYFLSSGVDNPPLHAPMDSSGSPNGVYAFTTGSIFPTNDFYGTNFWVDVVFSTTATGPPLSITTTSLPNVTQSSPYTQSLAASGGTPPYLWQIASGSLPPGITLSPAGQLSGTPTTVGSNSFTVKVTDSSLLPQSASQTLSLNIAAASGGQNNAELNGNYAFLFNGISGTGDNASGFAAVGRFTANGAGNISSGELDASYAGPGGVYSAQSFTGTYSIASNNTGTMTLAVAGTSVQLSFTMSANGGAQISQFNISSGAPITGSGALESSTASAFSTLQISGNYALGAAGLDPAGDGAAMVGRFSADGAGNLTNAAADLSAYGPEYPLSFTAAYYAVNDSAAGRGTMHLAFSYGGTPASLNFVFYVVNSSKLLIMESDVVTAATPLLNGVVMRQQVPTGGFTNASLNGSLALSLTGQYLCGGVVSSSPSTITGTMSSGANGNISLNYQEDYCGSPSSGTVSGLYSVAPNGRASVTLGGYTLTMYLAGSNQAFLYLSPSDVLFGSAAPPGSTILYQ